MRQMRPFTLVASILVSSVVAGCSLKSTPVAPVPSLGVQSVIRQDAHPANDAYVLPKLYVNQGTVGVLVYKQAGTDQAPIKILTNGLHQPEGEFVNSNGDLYVTNFQATSVSVFKRGANAPYKTLNDPGYIPGSAVVDSDGTVYVCNYENSSPNPPGDIAVYAGGATSPTSSLPAPVSGDWVLWCALDGHHNLYVGYTNENSGGSNVAEYPGGAGTGQLLNLKIGFPGQMEFNSKGNLVAADELNYQIDTFKLPGTKPIGTITAPVTGPPIVGMTLNANSSHVYMADYNSGQVYEFAYPKGTLLDTITPSNGAFDLQGLAADPSAPL